MALPNPVLTWQASSSIRIAEPSSANIIAAIETAVAELTGDQGWTTSTPTGDAAGLEATVLTPPATSPINGTITCLIGVSNGAEPAGAEVLNGHAPADGEMVCSIGGPYTPAGTNWYDPQPYGAAVRNIEFATWCTNVDTATELYVLASEESIAVVVIAPSGSNRWHFMTLMGAIVEPLDLASAESDERVYGMMTTGDNSNDKIITPISGTGGWGADASGSGDMKAAFFDPRDPTTTLRMENIRQGNTNVSIYSGQTLGGNPVFQPILIQQTGGGAIVGRHRGVYYYQDGYSGQIVQNADGSDAGYLVGVSDTQVDECLVFGNAS